MSQEPRAAIEVTVTLRIFGDDLEPSEITTLLGCEPTRAQRKGGPRPGASPPRAVTTGGWWLETDQPRDADLEAHVRNILSRCTGDLAAWRQITERFRADLFCGVFLNSWNNGYLLSPALLVLLAERRLQIGFDIYAPVDTWPDGEAQDEEA